jgi:putative flippase GtrA
MSESVTDILKARLSTLRSRARFTRFAGVGFVGTAVDNATLFALVSMTALGPKGGKVIAWIVAICVIFVINERWTFSSYGAGGTRAMLRRLLRSYLFRFGGFLVTLAVLGALVRWFDIWYILANLVGIGVGFFVNYTFESLYTWKVHEK